MHREKVHESEENGGDYEVNVLDGDECRCACGCDRVGRVDDLTSCDVCDRSVVKSCLVSNWKGINLDVCTYCKDVGPVALLLAQREQLHRDRAWALRAIRDFDRRDKDPAITNKNDYAYRFGSALGALDYVRSMLGGKHEND